MPAAHEDEMQRRIQQLEDQVARLTEAQQPTGHRCVRIRSKTVLLGLPLYDIAVGPAHSLGEFRGIARGWFAFGDIALGGIAIGGVAVGLLSAGGLAFGGIVAVGGAAVGGVAIGGAAAGVLAIGGAAIGYAAYGGGALSLGHLLQGSPPS